MYDGITNIEMYAKSPVKLMFLLKEPYGDGITSHAEYLNNDNVISDVKTHRAVSKIATAILRNLKSSDNWNLSEEDYLKDFKSVAWVNVGKYPAPNGTSTPKPRLKLCYSVWKDIVLKQINGYDPDIFFAIRSSCSRMIHL